MQEYVSLLDPEELEVKRVDLSLGLRSAMRFYNDLSAPGVGSVFFVRQITWSCLAIKHARDLGVSTISLANALEALGLKAHFNTTDEYNFRGRRAFTRTTYDKEKSFKGLLKDQNYVQVRYRQNTSRTLPEDTGLGFVDSGSGYEAYTLSSAGHELVNQHALQFNLGNVIGLWVKGSQTPTVSKASEYFGPFPSKGEKRVVLNRLLSDVAQNYPGIRGDVARRRNLIEVFKDLPEGWDSYNILELTKGHRLFVQDYLKGQEFFEMLAAGRKILAGVHQLLANTGSKVKTCSTGLDQEVTHLIEAASKFLHVEGDPQEPNIDAYKFASYVIAHRSSPEMIVAEVVNRDRRVSMLMDDEIVTGPLFNKDELFTAEKFDFAVPFQTIRNFYSLWKDCL